jgi:hypothetical protein
MKTSSFLIALLSLFVFSHLNLESRQYNVDYLIDLIEADDEEGIKQFFSQPNYVTKVKHIIEFTELFREKLEERFGYKPSYREAYDYFKDNLSSMNMPSDQQDQLLSFFKEVVKQSELAEKHHYKFNSDALNLNDSSDSDFEIPNELAIAYNEALGGALMCVIPSPM